jgi:hypothetical protein
MLILTRMPTSSDESYFSGGDAGESDIQSTGETTPDADYIKKPQEMRSSEDIPRIEISQYEEAEETTPRVFTPTLQQIAAKTSIRVLVLTAK